MATTKLNYRHEDNTTPAIRRAAVWSLFVSLVERDIKGRYRRTFLGLGWAVFQPLAYMLIFMMLRGLLDISSGDTPYALFSYAGMTYWSLFTNGVTTAGPSIARNSGLVRKLGVSRELFPLTSIATALIDFLIAFLLLIAMMLFFMFWSGWAIQMTLAWLWLPVLMALAMLLSFAVGLIPAAFGTFRRDIIYAIPFLMQFWLLATPILYPLEQVPDGWLAWYCLNPMVGLTEGFKQIMLHGQSPDGVLLLMSVTVTLLILSVSRPIFRSMSQYFADVM